MAYLTAKIEAWESVELPDALQCDRRDALVKLKTQIYYRVDIYIYIYIYMYMYSPWKPAIQQQPAGRLLSAFHPDTIVNQSRKHACFIYTV